MVLTVFRTIKLPIQLNLFVKIIPTVDSFILWLLFTLEVQRFCQKSVIFSQIGCMLYLIAIFATCITCSKLRGITELKPQLNNPEITIRIYILINCFVTIFYRTPNIRSVRKKSYIYMHHISN